MRRGLLALAALGVVGTMAELAILRHWETASELIPWVVLAGAGIMVLIVAFRPTSVRVRVAGAVGLLLAGAGLYGLFIHVGANLSAAPLDGAIGPTWDSLTVWNQLWLAATGGVGPAPTLSAASLTPTGLALALATYRHPALTSPEPNVPLRGAGTVRH